MSHPKQIHFMLHNHPQMEKDKQIDVYHVIIDKDVYIKLKEVGVELMKIFRITNPFLGLEGTISNVKTCDRALTEEEIKAEYERQNKE